ncbi:hypothetical protein D3C76_1319620 [compost metagenome]
MPAALATHVRQYRAGDVEQAEHVGGEQTLRFVGTGFFHRAQHAETGIVDQHVNPPETLDACCDSLMRLFLAGDVQPHGEQVGVIAQAIGDVLWIAGSGDHRVTGTQGVLCDEGAKTTGSASNEPGTHINSSCRRPWRHCRGLLDGLMRL